MADDMQNVLDAIEKNHVEVKTLLDTIALGTGRIEAELATVKTDIRDLQSSVARIETKLDRHESRIEAHEARP